MENLPSIPSKFCLQCDDGTALEFTTKDVVVEASGESCVVPNVTGWHCPVCGEIEYIDQDSSERVWDAIDAVSTKARARDAALLVHARKRLKLTQKQKTTLLYICNHNTQKGALFAPCGLAGMVIHLFYRI